MLAADWHFTMLFPAKAHGLYSNSPYLRERRAQQLTEQSIRRQ